MYIKSVRLKIENVFILNKYCLLPRLFFFVFIEYKSYLRANKIESNIELSSCLFIQSKVRLKFKIKGMLYRCGWRNEQSKLYCCG